MPKASYSRAAGQQGMNLRGVLFGVLATLIPSVAAAFPEAHRHIDPRGVEQRRAVSARCSRSSSSTRLPRRSRPATARPGTRRSIVGRTPRAEGPAMLWTAFDFTKVQDHAFFAREGQQRRRPRTHRGHAAQVERRSKGTWRRHRVAYRHRWLAERRGSVPRCARDRLRVRQGDAAERPDGHHRVRLARPSVPDRVEVERATPSGAR